MKGELFRCLEQLPGGTVIIEMHRREIAICMALAKSISVKITSSDSTQGGLERDIDMHLDRSGKLPQHIRDIKCIKV